MAIATAQAEERLFAPDPTRPCFTCGHRTPMKVGVMMGPRCTHPMITPADLILGLPQMCDDVRRNPMSPCGPGGHLHSMAPSATLKAS